MRIYARMIEAVMENHTEMSTASLKLQLVYCESHVLLYIQDAASVDSVHIRT